MSKLKKTVDKLLAKTTIDEKVKAKLDKLLDKTEVDEKLIEAWKDAEESGLIDKIKCYCKCYGGYLLAVGAGCLFGVNGWWGLIFLAGAAAWAYWVTHCNNNAKCKR
tara:strand:+ start:989 stop:1309 length:321 start_codon:yes stop_codon:yes gene_type:complete